MKQQVISFINRFSGTLYSLLLFGFFGLSLVASHYNFSLPRTETVRDAADFVIATELLEKLEHVKSPAESGSAVPQTSRVSALTPRRVSAMSGFSIKNPTPTSDNSTIRPGETGVLVYDHSFFFAHSDQAFDWIKYASEGDTFTVSRNGTVEVYQIIKKQTLSMSGDYGGKRPVSAYYSSISKKRQFLGKTYDVALRTCGDGTTGRNGNNNAYRTFVFANRLN